MEQPKRVRNGRLQRTCFGDVRDMPPVDCRMSSAEQLEVVQPDEPDEAVAGCVRRQVHEFFFGCRHEHRQAVAEREVFRTCEQHIGRELAPEPGVGAKVKLDRRFARARHYDVMAVLQEVLGGRTRFGGVPTLRKRLERHREVIRPDQ